MSNMSNVTKKVKYMTEEEIAMKVIKLNPDITFFAFSSTLKPFIKSSIPPEKLTLPYGCYYNEKNGITNKHNTIEGFYATLPVRVD